MSDKQESDLLQSLKSENQHLRDLVVSLSAALLRKIALHPPRERSDSSDAERLLQEAQACFRCARSPGLKREIADGLEAAGHEFMAKAVEIETRLQRDKRKK
jgi:hypothetical protein